MNLNTWFDKGLSKEDYIATLQKHRDSFMHIYRHFEIPEEDHSFWQQKQPLRAVVLAEEWCGHCMMDIPILLHITEQANMPIRFLPRDQHLELMDQYTTNGKRIIPIFIFIDQDGNEVAKWGPMAPEVEQFVNELKEALPAKESPDYDEKFQAFIKRVSETFQTDTNIWQYVYHDVKKTLQQ